EPLALPLPVLLDPVAELREALPVRSDHRVDHTRNWLLEARQLPRSVARPHLEVGDVLVTEATPHLPLGRHGNRLVATAADQVEERGGEFVGARLLVLAEKRRY